MTRKESRQFTRRALVRIAGLTGLAALSACTPAASPTAAPATTAPKPAASPAATTAPAAAAKPTANAAASPAAKPTFSPVTIAVGTDSGMLERVPPLVAEHQGYFKEFNVTANVQTLADGSKVLAGVVAGELQIGESGITNVLAAIEKGGDIKLIATTHLPVAYVFYSSKEIQSLKDLEGKSVGTGAIGAFLHQLAVATLAKNGVNVDKVNFVNIGSSLDVYKAIAAGKVDAGPSTITFVPRMEEDGVKPLVNIWEALPDYIAIGMYSSGQAIKEHRDGIVRTLAAYAKTYRFTLSDAGKAVWVERATKDLAEDEATANYEWQWLKEHNGLQVDLSMSPAQVEYVQQVNVSTGQQSKILPFEQVADLSLAKEALALL